MAKPRILHIITRIDRGGSAQNVLISVNELRRLGYKVGLLTGSLKAKSINAKIINHLVPEIHPLRDILAFFSIYRYIKKTKYDIVHTHTSKAGFIGRFAAILAGSKKIIYTPHGHIFHGYFGPFLTKFFILLERLAGKFTHKIVALTPSEAQDYIYFGVVKDKSKLRVIPSGVDESVFFNNGDKNSLRKKLGFDEDKIIIFNAGRLVPIKGHEYLVKIAEIVIKHSPHALFVIAGGGPLRSNISQAVKRMRLENNFILLGERDDIPLLLNASDIFVMTSKNEGMCRSVVEAMLCKLPVVAFNVCGLRDVVLHGKTGFLVKPFDINAFASAIIKFIDNKNLRLEFGEAGYEYAKSTYTKTVMIDKLQKLYSEW